MNTISFSLIAGWVYAVVLVIIGVLNLFLVHPVPGIAYLLFSLIYFPPVSDWVAKKFRVKLPVAVKIVFGIFIMWFTLGISDLADIYHI